jgi:hypothetical protein
MSRQSAWTAAAGTAIGLGVPVVVFGAALCFSLWVDDGEWVGFSRTHMAWTAAALVGLAGVICGTILAVAGPGAAAPSSGGDAHRKPEVEDYVEGIGRRR